MGKILKAAGAVSITRSLQKEIRSYHGGGKKETEKIDVIMLVVITVYILNCGRSSSTT